MSRIFLKKSIFPNLFNIGFSISCAHITTCLSRKQLLKKLGEQKDLSIPNPLHHPDYFDVHKLVKMEDLFNARVHYGHKDTCLNEYMLPYIFGSRLGITIIDLNKTLSLMRQALNFIAHIVFKDGIVLFVSQHRETSHLVEKTAQEIGEFAHCRYFSSHVLTNSVVYFNGVIRLPDLIIVLNTFDSIFKEHQAIRDSAKLLIPTVAIVDSNSDPRLITYPIPGNDDSLASIELYCNLFKQTILIAKEKRKNFMNKYGIDPLKLDEYNIDL